MAMNLQVPKMLGSSLVAAQLAASQEGLICTELLMGTFAERDGESKRKQKCNGKVVSVLN
jgi:hypothetical protein